MSAYLTIDFPADQSSSQKAECHLIVMTESHDVLSGDEAQQSEAKQEAAAIGFTASGGNSHLMSSASGLLLIVGIGEAPATKLAAEKAGAHLYNAMRKSTKISAVMASISLDASLAASLLSGAMSQSYEFNRYFTKKEETKQLYLSVVASDKAVQADFVDAEAMLKGVFLARDLVTEPANSLYPGEFVRHIEGLKHLGLEIEVLGETEMEALGMGALLGVGQGSSRDSYMAIMKWNGGGDEQPLAFVGKGVCFDTGGISLKPAKGMEDMKWDMGGAAAVTGAMCAIAARGLKKNVVGIVGLVENMPDGMAQRPGDVVTSMSGQTIEVINTDAEGRLVLADCLTYCQQEFKPQMIIDLATLTGAIIVALGKEYAGLFANDDSLSTQIVEAGQQVEEKCWPMPMGDAYDKMLKSHIADMKNIGGPWGGSITAACFLERFIDDGMRWAHIDIAGKAWADSAGHAHPSGGTGFGVRLLNQIVDNWQS